MRQTLKLLIEMGPLVIFFATWRFGDLFMATAAFMGATVLGLIGTYVLEKRLAPMPLVTAAVVMVFGGLTLYLHDERFIKMKPTVVYTIFAVTLLGGLATGRPLIKYVFSHVFHLSDRGWRQLTIRWGLFFIFAAILNEYIWRNYSEEFWVSFKVWGFMSLTLAFAVWQSIAIQKYQIGADEPGE